MELKPGYLKALHRRAKAYHALGKYEWAVRDFHIILEQEPENNAVNNELKDARTELIKSQKKEASGENKEKDAWTLKKEEL